MPALDFHFATHEELILHEKKLSRRMRVAGITPGNILVSSDYLAAWYKAPEHDPCWMIQRLDGEEIWSSWSHIRELLQALQPGAAFAEYYPKPEEIVNARNVRWFWQFGNLPSATNLFNIGNV